MPKITEIYNLKFIDRYFFYFIFNYFFFFFFNEIKKIENSKYGKTLLDTI
jgi:hypothetical protein